MEPTTHDLSGTRIHATLRAEDLIPAFLGAADAAIEYWSLNWSERFANGLESCKTIGQWHASLGELERQWSKIPDGPERSQSDLEDMDYLLHESLFDLLDSLAPEGYYFGATEGDGSDFGFWQFDDDDD